MLNKRLILISIILFLLILYVSPVKAPNIIKDDSIYEESPKLTLLNHGYPRFFQFRNSEGQASNGRYTYEEWEKLFSSFDGIMGKVLEEEVSGRSRGLPYFQKYKESYPEKLVMLHYNGRSRDPGYDTSKFFAGHWLYYNGSIPQSEIPEAYEDTEIKVPNPNLFHVNMGRYGSSNDDLVICSMNAEGKPDWNKAEQVQLIAIDKVKKTITVRRGCYNTTPIKFEKGHAWIAVHVTEGPWGKNSRLLWNYNYSLDCPRDKNGKNCTDIFVDDMADRFITGGALSLFDGVEFDVLMSELGSRNIDTNGDGIGDNGYINGENRFGLGVYQMLSRLRDKLGDKKYILADGMSTSNQRGFDLLNGIESEGWPILTDIEITDWSGGLNRHLFWNKNARQPTFHYINHKYRNGGDENIDAPDNINRLVMAVAQITDAVFTYSNQPHISDKTKLPVWDELVKGRENVSGWLGYPKSGPVRLAKSSPDLLNASGMSMDNSFISMLIGENIKFESSSKSLTISSKAISDVSADKSLSFKLSNLKTAGQDLTIFMNIAGEAQKGYPTGMGRVLWVTAVDVKGKVLGKHMSWINDKSFEASFYFKNIETPSIDLIFEVKGSEPVCISDFTVHAYPDAIYRDFENGAVLVNPALHPVEFNLAQIFPGEKLRKIQGTYRQDPITNNGAPVEASVKLGQRDGLFLVKE